MDRSIKIIDTFCFNGEPIVKLRLQYLCQQVDEFVIIEAEFTHSGKKKPFLYKNIYRDWFEPYITKIHWIVVSTFPEITESWYLKYKVHSWMGSNHDHWFREAYQRDASIDYIQKTYESERYILCVCDVDEIPDAHSLDFLRGKDTFERLTEPLYLEMVFFYYSFKWIKPYKWHRALIIKDNHLLSNSSLTYWRIQNTPILMCKNSGWHCSYFMNYQDLTRKIESFAHRECDKHEYKDDGELIHCIQNGKDLFKRGVTEDLIAFSGLLPECFLQFSLT